MFVCLRSVFNLALNWMQIRFKKKKTSCQGTDESHAGKPLWPGQLTLANAQKTQTLMEWKQRWSDESNIWPKIKKWVWVDAGKLQNMTENTLKYHNVNPYDSCTLMHIQICCAAFIYAIHFHAKWLKIQFASLIKP